MKISFVVPAFNEQDHIGLCLASILAEIGRNATLAEVIVVDNNSTDHTGQIAKEMGATVVVEHRKGVVFARQAGFEQSKGEFVAFIDADNVLPQDWLAKVLASFTDGTVAVSGPVVYHDLSILLRLFVRIYYGLAWASHQMLVMLQGGNFIVRSSALKEVGGLDRTYEFFGEDTAQAIRLAKAGKIRFIRDLWVYSSGRRLTEDGVMSTCFRYALSYYWAHLAGRPLFRNYNDIRL